MTSTSAADALVEKMLAHQARFACHACGTPSVGPYCPKADDGTPPPEEACDWEMPRDLLRCERCRRWTCRTHIKNMGFESWWICVLCFHQLVAQIAVEAGDAPA